MSIFSDNGASWIWLPRMHGQDFLPNSYADFRQSFNWDGQGKATLYISAGTEYAAWINGRLAGFNQYDDFPNNKSYDTLDVTSLLKEGKNALCVRSYHQGTDSFQYIAAQPGLIFFIEGEGVSCASGSGTLCRPCPSYVSGEMEKLSPQLSYTYAFDARKEDEWLEDGYVPEGWTEAAGIDGTDGFYPRPIKKLELGGRIKVKLVSQGVFLRRESEGTPAYLMQRDFLSHREGWELFNGWTGVFPSKQEHWVKSGALAGADGIYIVLDLGRMEAGLPELAVCASEGVVIDIAHGEHLDDLRVRSFVGGRNFAARYICRKGRQSFIHWFKRCGGRYLQLHISGDLSGFGIYCAGLRPTDYPMPVIGNFRCSDSFYGKVFDVGVHTLRLCMHEHYEDTPWREQALYGMDSRMQALCGYYVFGDYDFPIACYERLGESAGDDGYTGICAPANFFATIPSFSMAWVMETGDWLMHSGGTSRAAGLLPAIKRLLDGCVSKLDDGLLPTPSGKRYWNFYEWAPGLDNGEALSPDYKGIGRRFDAPLNLFLILALDAGAFIAEHCGENSKAEKYREAASLVRDGVRRYFRDDATGLFSTYVGEGDTSHRCELTQSLALVAGVCEGEDADRLRRVLCDEENGLVKVTLSYSLYKFQALMGNGVKFGKSVFSMIERDWGHMLYSGSTAFWETIKGADDFGNAGSMSHGWSATPVYFFQTALLGVIPLEPGFRRFTVSPLRGITERASGRVPTPHGFIEVEWRDRGGELDLKVSHPDGTEWVKV